MVQILVQISDSCCEWGLVELQGQLETRDQVPFDNMHIGDLHFVRGTPSLVIGHHLLSGKVVDLEKPFAVLRKKVSASSRNSNHGGTSEADAPSPRDEECDVMMETSEVVQEHIAVNTEYEVIAVIQKKIVFKNRPKPIITKPLPKKM